MNKLVRGLMVFCLFFFLSKAAEASNYRFTWECDFASCSFSANPAANIISYNWKFGDSTYGTGQNTAHAYTPCCGSGFYTPRVTLTYHLTNGSYINVRCYIQYYAGGGIGGDPTPPTYGGTCQGFN